MNDVLQADLGIFKQISASIGGRKTPHHIKYNCVQAFEGIDLTKKNVLEIGAGEGILSAYAAVHDAQYVVALEPEAAGSDEGYASTIQHIRQKIGALNLEVVNEAIQDWDSGGCKFDVVLLWNSINHLDEPMCEQLHYSDQAKNVYRSIFQHISDMMSPGSKLIISDCSRYNFFQMIHVKHPITPQIEWKKHQTPETWVKILEPLGFSKETLFWTIAYPLRKLSLLLSNRIAAFFLFSHFRLVLSYQGQGVNIPATTDIF